MTTQQDTTHNFTPVEARPAVHAVIDPADRRAAQQEAEKLIRAALGAQYPIYKKRKKAQEIGGSGK